MIFINKIKKFFVDAVKEHPVSIISFFISSVLYSITLDNYNELVIFERLLLVSKILMGFAFGALLCEAIHSYRKKNDNYSWKHVPNIISNVAIVLVAAICPIPSWLMEYSSPFNKQFGRLDYLYSDLFDYINYFIFATLILLAIFFFYKKSEETFEVYATKAFCGLMKAALVYGVVTIGILSVYWACDTLLVHSDDYEMSLRIAAFLYGLVAFPCTIAGLTKTEGGISKFAKTLFTYVLPIIVAISFLIIYIYIFKIIFTWTFPRNEVFSIISWVFCAGFAVWTLAQGCFDEHFEKPLKIMPFTFIPFIILQIVCLVIRISNYGFTVTRYYGLALIVFEIAYFVFYTIKFCKDRDVTSGIIFVAIGLLFITLLAPGINAHSSVTLSHSPTIEHFLKLGDKATKTDKELARNAYLAIDYEGGISGYNYLKKNLKPEDLKRLALTDDYDYYEDGVLYDVYDDEDVEDEDVLYGENSTQFDIFVSSKVIGTIDISGLNKIYIPDIGSEDDINVFPAEDERPNIEAIPICIHDEELGTINLKDPIEKLIELEKNRNASESYEYDEEIEDEKSELFSEPFELSDGGKVFISYVNITGEFSDDAPGYKIDIVEINGFVVK